MNCNIDRKRTMETASNNTWESKTAIKRTLPRPTPKFNVTYSQLCDGGAQEMSTAVGVVRDIFPDASIQTHRRTSEEDVRLGKANPEVIISSNGEVLWSSKQKNLYQKYPKKRKKSMKEIKKALEALKNGGSRDVSANSTVAIPSALLLPEATAPVAPVEVSEDFEVPPSASLENAEEEDEEGFCCSYPLR